VLDDPVRVGDYLAVPVLMAGLPSRVLAERFCFGPLRPRNREPSSPSPSPLQSISPDGFVIANLPTHGRIVNASPLIYALTVNSEIGDSPYRRGCQTTFVVGQAPNNTNSIGLALFTCA
jgi:hypothetical protein